MAERERLGLALALSAAVVLAACSPLGRSEPNSTMCPPAALEQLRPPVATTPVTYGVLIDRAYTGDAKRSPSYPWPQLPKAALETVAATLPKLDLRPGDAVFGAWISHRSNDTREIFLPLRQVRNTPSPELPPMPTAPKLPVNKLECNEYATKVQAFNASAKEWQAQVDEQQRRSLSEDQRSVAAFLDATSSFIRAAAPIQDPLGTDIYGSLAVAAGVFGASPGKHKLLLFSDMTDTVRSPVRPDLAQSDVLVALYHRDDPADQGRGQREWEAAFRSLGVRGSVFLPWAATTPDKLAEQLTRTGR